MINKKISVTYGRTSPTSVPYEVIRISATIEGNVEEEEDEVVTRRIEFEKLKKFVDKKINETKF